MNKDRVSHTLGDAPIEDKYRAMLNELARAVDYWLNGKTGPKKLGFVMLMFEFENHEGKCNYISNAKREDVVVLLREQLRRFEGAPDVSGKA